jgi:phage shock protein A
MHNALMRSSRTHSVIKLTTRNMMRKSKGTMRAAMQVSKQVARGSPKSREISLIAMRDKQERRRRKGWREIVDG